MATAPAYIDYSDAGGRVMRLPVSPTMTCQNRPAPGSLLDANIKTMVADLPTPPPNYHWERQNCTITDGPWVEATDDPPSFIADATVEPFGRVEPYQNGSVVLRFGPLYTQLPHVLIERSGDMVEDDNYCETFEAEVGGLKYFSLRITNALAADQHRLTLVQDGITRYALFSTPLSAIETLQLVADKPDFGSSPTPTPTPTPTPAPAVDPTDRSGQENMGIGESNQNVL